MNDSCVFESGVIEDLDGVRSQKLKKPIGEKITLVDVRKFPVGEMTEQDIASQRLRRGRNMKPLTAKREEVAKSYRFALADVQ